MLRGTIITVVAAGAVAALGVAALQAAPEIKQSVSNSSEATPPKPKAEKPVAAKPAAKPASVTAPKPATSAPAPQKPSAPKPRDLTTTGKLTPMAERVAVVGFLNKRNGISRDLTLKPGEAVRIGDVVIKLRACETTAPWEPEKLTGAFVQLLVNDSDKKWRRYFSGWLYKETPSLNVVEHPVYDVWTKDCQMLHPATGPNTKVVRGGEEPQAKRGEGDEE